MTGEGANVVGAFAAQTATGGANPTAIVGMAAALPPIDFSQILLYEKDDSTDVKKELACVSGVCEIDDLHVDATATK